jgi:AcrR family transcriptional regulator
LFSTELPCRILDMRDRPLLVPAGTPANRSGRPTLLDRVTDAFVARPGASLGELAAAAGIGRTTLHEAIGGRREVMVAVANHAVDRCAAALRAAVEEAPEPDPVALLRRIVAGLLDHGALLAFFFRQPALDEDEALLQRQSAELDEPIVRQVRAAREAGALRSDSPEWWAASAVYALVYVAWEGVQRGWLARLDAPELVLRTLLRGEGAPDAE